jgi:hypothetical protein
LYKNKQSAGLHPLRQKIEKDVIGILLGDALKRASLAANAVGAFKATEIIIVNQNAIPCHLCPVFMRCLIDRGFVLLEIHFWVLATVPTSTLGTFAKL